MLVRAFGRRPSPTLVISLAALFVASSGWGWAATGGSFILGSKNSAGRTTQLSSSVKHAPTLAVANTAGNAAASFVVRRGVPPLAVTSDAKVNRLNADQLDGLDSGAFYRAGSKVADSDRLDGLDSPAFQKRVSGTCATGTAIRVVNADGGVTCQSVGGTGFWSILGNAGTTTANFLGTTDAKPLVVKTSNVEALRVDPAGNVGVGTTTPVAKLDVSAAGTAVAATSSTTGVVGRVGGASCSGTFGVGGCATGTGNGVDGRADAGVGVAGLANTGRGVQGFSGTGIGVIGDSTTRGVVGTLNRGSCGGFTGLTFGVGGCGGAAGAGLFGASNTSASTLAAIEGLSLAGGNIFIGRGVNAINVAVPRVRIDVNGKGFFNGGTQTGGADYAESVPSAGKARLEPGDVLAIDPRRGFAVRRSQVPNSPLVAGVYSTRPAVLAVGNHGVDDSLAGEAPVALLGVVPTKVSAENGAVRPGDLLTTASTPGYAMKASAVLVRGVPTYRTGTILGKALEPLRSGRGPVRVLVMLR